LPRKSHNRRIAGSILELDTRPYGTKFQKPNSIFSILLGAKLITQTFVEPSGGGILQFDSQPDPLSSLAFSGGFEKMHEQSSQSGAPHSRVDRDSQTRDVVAFIPPSKHAIPQNLLTFNENIVEICVSTVQDLFDSLIGKRMGLEETRIVDRFKGTKKN
jgi:hypothetical protein